MTVSCVRIPKYRLHKGSGQAIVQIAGQRFYLGKHGSEESQERYRRYVAELCSGSPGSSSPPAEPGTELTITEVISRYWKYCQRYYVLKDGQPSGWQNHIQLVLRLLREIYGRTQAGEFGPKRFKAFRQTLVDAGHSRKYINKLTAVVRGTSIRSLPGFASSWTANRSARRCESTASVRGLYPDDVYEIAFAQANLPRVAGMTPGEVDHAMLGRLMEKIAERRQYEQAMGLSGNRT